MRDMEGFPDYPVRKILSELITRIRSNDSLVLVAPPGAGKTSLVPACLLSEIKGNICLVQPRRLAAKAAAMRVSQILKLPLGQEVGYQVRFESKCSARTRLIALTPGVLTGKFLEDPFLSDTQLIVFDEFHERNLEIDFLLGLARYIQKTVRPDLKILVMSATLDIEAVAHYLDDCPRLVSEGRLFPVREKYHPRAFDKKLELHVREVVTNILTQEEGDILVFLPGMGEIRRCQNVLGNVQGIDVHVLHGDISLEAQERALLPSTQRKIILSTNIAETSVTVQGVRIIVDSGLVRKQFLDSNTSLNRLDTVPISLASAEQRKGRAGREAPGLCVRLWSEREHSVREEFDLAEIHRVDLAETLLKLLAFGESDWESFPWFESPPSGRLKVAFQLLELLGAVDKGRLTPLGLKMAAIPVHPRLAAVVLKALEYQVLEPAAMAVAILSEKSPFDDPGWCPDFCEQVEALIEWDNTGKTSHRSSILRERADRILRLRNQILRLFLKQQTSRDLFHEHLGMALLAGFPDRVIKRREGDSTKGIMTGGRGVLLPRGRSPKPASFLVGLQVSHGDTESKVCLYADIDLQWLEPRCLKVERIVVFEEQSEKLVARQQTSYLDLMVDEKQSHLEARDLDGGALAKALVGGDLKRIQPERTSKAGQLLERLAILGETCPELNLPSWSQAKWMEELKWVCAGKKSLEEVRCFDWYSLVHSSLDYSQQNLLDRELPEDLILPSGKKFRLVYEQGKQPLLEARIQELFGWTESPKLARGRITVLISLLAPNYRSQQLTSDLASFWKVTYPQVRKDLRGRYPKHKWPEDPLNEKGGA